jgi:rod shape-determining protein MreD
MSIKLPWRFDGARRALIAQLAWVAAFMLAVPLQSAVMSETAVRGTVPDVPLLVLLLFAVFHGPTAGFAAGAGLGAILDLFSAGVTVFYTVVYAGLGAGAALAGRVTANVRAATLLTVVASASLILGGAHVIWFQPFDRADDMARWMGSALVPQTLYNSALGAIAYAVWIWWFPPPRQPLKDQDGFFSSGRFSGPVR